MKVVIFAGGIGARISEELEALPKPMVEIGGKPVIWHIMKYYSHFGFNEFIICLGYKGYLIKEYFLHYFMHNSDIRIDMATNNVEILDTSSEAFKVTLVDTGLATKTAGRLQLVKEYLRDDDFMLTYGNYLSDVDLSKLVKFHKKHGKIATVTSVQQELRFGMLEVAEDGEVLDFKEHAKNDCQWISGGFFVLKPQVFNYLQGNMADTIWEDEPVEQLTAEHQLMAYRHEGYWKSMDAQRDKTELEDIWKNNQAKWKKW